MIEAKAMQDVGRALPARLGHIRCILEVFEAFCRWKCCIYPGAGEDISQIRVVPWFKHKL